MDVDGRVLGGRRGGFGMRAMMSHCSSARIGKGQRFFVRSAVDARSML